MPAVPVVPIVAVRARRWLVIALASALVATSAALGAAAPVALGAGETYRNPMEPTSPVGVVESCADPSVIRGQRPEDDHLWFMYCTTDPLGDDDRVEGSDDLRFRLIPIFSSADLVNWTYEGDAFAARPDWVGDTAGMWAPEIVYFDGLYRLYYGASHTDGGSSAIGVATSESPLGPWEDAGDPVVDPYPAGQWIFDPEVNATADGARWLFFGSYYGGIKARLLTPDGEETVGSDVPITIDNRYEGAEVAFHDGWYYLFVSATNCCNGPLTAYGVFAGRSRDLLGPYVDAEGVSLLEERVGGTPVIAQNGNRWVGPGHNTVFRDFAGQWWTMYHAVDVTDPYFEGAVGFTKRPALLDAIDWIGGWPTLNGGRGPSDTPQHVPAAQPGEATNHVVRTGPTDTVGDPIWADEFDDGTLSGWDWIREPAGPGAYGESGGRFRMASQAADLHVDSDNAAVLVRDAPAGNYVVETRVRFDPPLSGCCYNYRQVGLVAYGGDDRYVKLVHVSIWNTRQTEFAKEVDGVPAGYPRYGNTVVGPTGDWTWLRIVRRTSGAHVPGGTYGGDELYTAYTSHDGITWSRGATWVHDLGADARIGLVAMGGAGSTAEFDYVRVSELVR